MEELKRRRSSIYTIYNFKKKKFEVSTSDTNYFSAGIITSFEHLPDAVIYEIFEHFDYFYLYKNFINLNQRFRNLLTAPTRPIKIHLSSISRATFAQYYKTIIIHNRHRINSLRISNLFMYNARIFPLFHTISKLPRLKILIFDNIEAFWLENLLPQIISLPYLSSLIVTTIDNVENKNNIYSQIFCFPTLKYCKLSLGKIVSAGVLPFATNKYSAIEHIVLNNDIYLHQLDSFLSYLPQLRRLSFDSLRQTLDRPTIIYSTILNHLTHLSLKIGYVSFHQFRQMTLNLFPSIQVLRISSDARCMNANRWKQLISSYIPDLRIFDVWFDFIIHGKDHLMKIDAEIKQFKSTFWKERQWFFEYGFYQLGNRKHVIFYSTKPYRRINFTLHAKSREKVRLIRPITHMTSVEHIHIQREEDVINCMHYFPNATKLTFGDDFYINRMAFTSTLNRVVRLQNLTTLIIESTCLSFRKLLELLYFLSNIHTLNSESLHFYKNDIISIQQTETFRSISKRNIIANATVDDACTLEKVKLLVTLCPRLQNLTIRTPLKEMEVVLQYLMERTNPYTGRLVSICFMRASLNSFRQLESLVKTGSLPRPCMCKYIDSKLYIWW